MGYSPWGRKESDRTEPLTLFPENVCLDCGVRAWLGFTIDFKVRVQLGCFVTI